MSNTHTIAFPLTKVHRVWAFSLYQHNTNRERPYYLRDDYVRQDLREDQNGTTLYLDIGVLDISSCQPVTDAFVEIWGSNAQGDYSAFVNAPRGSSPVGTKTTRNNFLRGGYSVNENGIVELMVSCSLGSHRYVSNISEDYISWIL